MRTKEVGSKKKYSIIFADPPWADRTYSQKGRGRSAESHYPTMCIEDIKALPVGELAAKDCTLFLWITFPCLCEALEVLTAWGFSYGRDIAMDEQGRFTDEGYVRVASERWDRQFNGELDDIPDEYRITGSGEAVERDSTIAVLIVEPGKEPYVKEIDSDLKSLQHEVGGCIEAIYPYEDPVALICNEEGKLEGLPLNRALRDEDGDIYDVVAGTFMVVGLTDDSFGSLTVEQMQKFSDHFKVPEQFVKLGDKIVAIPMISKEQQKQESVEQKDFEMNADTSGLTVAGHIGTWHTIDRHEVGGHSFYLMEHDTYGDEAACIIVDERGKLVLDDVYNGFDDDTLRLLDLEVKEVPEMPDPALSVQDMKDYGYAWAGVLPAGQEAAEKAMEKGCEVYRLYSDNTEGLCVDAKEIADHAAKGGMLGISKESWMAALEKENYLKAAEMFSVSKRTFPAANS